MFHVASRIKNLTDRTTMRARRPINRPLTLGAHYSGIDQACCRRELPLAMMKALVPRQAKGGWRRRRPINWPPTVGAHYLESIRLVVGGSFSSR